MTPCVRFKANVTLGDPPTSCQVRLLAVADEAVREFGRDITVTCGREAHASTDPHTRGLALDLRCLDWPPAAVPPLVAFLQRILGPAFTVIHETPAINPKATAEHIHVQARKGTVWPA